LRCRCARWERRAGGGGGARSRPDSRPHPPHTPLPYLIVSIERRETREWSLHRIQVGCTRPTRQYLCVTTLYTAHGKASPRGHRNVHMYKNAMICNAHGICGTCGTAQTSHSDSEEEARRTLVISYISHGDVGCVQDGISRHTATPPSHTAAVGRGPGLSHGIKPVNPSPS